MNYNAAAFVAGGVKLYVILGERKTVLLIVDYTQELVT